MKLHIVLGLLLLLTPLTAQSIEYQWMNEKGESIALAALKGKPVILHFWASWCPPCRSEMPAMNQWVKMHPDVQVVMISLDNNPDYAAKFYHDKGIQAPLNMGSMRATSVLGVRGLPTTLVIDAKGDIKKRHLGDLDWLDEEVSKMVLSWL